MSARLAAETGFERRIITKFLREESLGSMCPGWPVLVGQLSIGVMTLLVCLCGSPLAPDSYFTWTSSVPVRDRYVNSGRSAFASATSPCDEMSVVWRARWQHSSTKNGGMEKRCRGDRTGADGVGDAILDGQSVRGGTLTHNAIGIMANFDFRIRPECDETGCSATVWSEADKTERQNTQSRGTPEITITPPMEQRSGPVTCLPDRATSAIPPASSGLPRSCLPGSGPGRAYSELGNWPDPS